MIDCGEIGHAYILRLYCRQSLASPLHGHRKPMAGFVAPAILLAALWPGFCQAENRGVLNGGDAPSERAAMRFFYTIPSGLQDEWEYTVPECRPLPVPVRQGLKNCVLFKEPGLNHLMCESSEYVGMANVLTGGKERAVLLRHVFSAKKACVRSRNKALESH